ncbi:arginase [Paenibacillus sp. PL2-23]|uniref:arginase n=1 Tax=Paenibacillus sp. PL2-23 TaxID=2100729 RepID=UPI0030FB0B58
MRRKERQPIGIISAPFGRGGAVPGAEYGPAALLQAGLEERLKALGRSVQRSEASILASIPHIDTPAAQAPAQTQAMKHEAQILQMSRSVAASTREVASSGAFPLLLGGDHSAALGSLAGLSRGGRRLGVIWLDAHGDINTELTSPSGNAHGMVLAASVGLSRFTLRDIDPRCELVQAHRIVIVGARDLDEGEKRLLAQHGIRCYTMTDVDRLGVGSVVRMAIAAASNGTDGIHVSLDLDVLDPLEAPGVGTPVEGGLTYREARYAMELLNASGAVTSMDIVEVNPKLDPSGRTAKLAVSLAETMFGKCLR